MSPPGVTLDDVRRARERIRDAVRCTPCLRAGLLREPAAAQGTVLLKLECLQVSGSFKARGASNAVAMLSAEELSRGLVTASGGNHGLGVAYAGWRAGTPVRVYLPRTTPPIKAERLERWGAIVELTGEVWDEANERAQQAAREEGLSYLHPFADPRVVAGQGTVGLEIVEQVEALDTVLVAIGGGGLIAGVATAIKALRPQVRVIGVEPQGAPTLTRALAAGRVVTLERITTAAGSLAPRASDPMNLAIVREHVDDIVLVDDEDMRACARWLWFELGLAVELSAAASVAALRAGGYRPSPAESVCAVVCGAGVDGIE